MHRLAMHDATALHLTTGDDHMSANEQLSTIEMLRQRTVSGRICSVKIERGKSPQSCLSSYS